MFGGLFTDPLGWIVDRLFFWVDLVPLWGWVVAAIAVVGLTYKMAGWPGVVALFTLGGVIYGRRSAPSNKPPRHSSVEPEVQAGPINSRPVLFPRVRNWLDRRRDGDS